MGYPPAVIVDQNDKVVDWKPLPEAWDKGLIHRLVYVIVQDAQGRLLLHQRSDKMVLDPLRWDTVAGHVDVTPDYEESARIELREEAGIHDADLEEIAYFYADSPYHDGKNRRRFIKIYKVAHEGGTSQPNDDEVAATRWFTKEELAQLVSAEPSKISLGLEICLPYIMDGYEDHGHQAAGQTHRPVLNIR